MKKRVLKNWSDCRSKAEKRQAKKAEKTALRNRGIK